VRVADRIELSPSGRSKCRACQRNLDKGALRLGVMVPNPFGEGETTHFYHLECGAWRQPDAYLVAVGVAVPKQLGTAPPGEGAQPAETGAPAAGTGAEGDAALRAAAEAERAASVAASLALLAGLDAERRESLRAEAEVSREHHRLRRFVKVERAKTARAHCRHCREAIDKGDLRLCLEIIEDGRVGAAGFVHLACARPYAGPVERVLPHLARSDDVTDQDFGLLQAALAPAG
jgi:hypothetical protein